MKIKVIPFQVKHINSIRVNDIEREEMLAFREDDFKHLENVDKSFSILIDDKVKACFGIVDIYHGRAEAWTLFDSDCKFCFVALFKIIKRYLDKLNIRRLEAHILKDFTAGHRWIKLLGFKLESFVLEKFGVTGKDYSLYVIIK